MTPAQRKLAELALASNAEKCKPDPAGEFDRRLDAERQSWDELPNSRAARLKSDAAYFAAHGLPGVTARMIVDFQDEKP